MTSSNELSVFAALAILSCATSPSDGGSSGERLGTSFEQLSIEQEASPGTPDGGPFDAGSVDVAAPDATAAADSASTAFSHDAGDASIDGCILVNAVSPYCGGVRMMACEPGHTRTYSGTALVCHSTHTTSAISGRALWCCE
jgi:hypothetical protein